MSRLFFPFMCLCSLALIACDDATVTGSQASSDTNTQAAQDTLTGAQDALAGPVDTEEPIAATPCISSRRPIVAAHGFVGAGDTWAPPARLFMANGYCREGIFAFDWNSVMAFTGNTNGSVPQLATLIDQVLAASGADQVDLIGHSAGGGVAYSYLSDAANAAKVANYAHVGSFPQSGPAGPNGEVPTLNVWSDGDMAIQGGGSDIPGATNLRQLTADHYAVATNAETFAAIFSHFNEGEVPATLEPIPTDSPEIWGRAVTFGENTPIVGDLSVYALDPATGARVGEPLVSDDVPSGGYWGPVTVEAGVPHEFTIVEAGDRPVHYYTEPFVSDNPFLYLRGFPGAGSMVGMLLAGLPFDDSRSILVVLSSSRALIYGQDSLTVDGQEMLTPQNASPEVSAIALFFYDEDEDGESSLAPISMFESFPFLIGADLGLPVSAGTFTVTLNDRTVVVPAWPSETEGATVVIFE